MNEPKNYQLIHYYDWYLHNDTSSTKYVEYALQFAEPYMKDRDIFIIKLRHGLIDGIVHTFKSISNKIETKIPLEFRKTNKSTISMSRARDLYFSAMVKLRHYHSRYRPTNE